MRPLFSSILVPLDGSGIAARSLGCATWLASRLASRLHILSATPLELPARDELMRLRVPEKHWPLVTLHQSAAYAPDAILEARSRHQVQLVVMTSRGAAAEAPPGALETPLPKVIGNVARAILEQSPVPVLLLPPNYQEALPWERILAPVSGEMEIDSALVLGVRLAHALNIEVHVAHVADKGESRDGLSARARYADAIYHEYPSQFAELVGRVVPECAPEECRHIVDLALCHGDVVEELRTLIERKQISLIVAGWHGTLLAGRACVLTQLIQTITIPILLVKPGRRTGLKLKVGEELE